MKRKINNKKLTIEDRINIQSGLHNHYTLSRISIIVHKNKSTVSREIKRNGIISHGYKKCKYFVCNVCPNKGFCNKPKLYYDCNIAQKKADNIKVSSRAKSYLSETDINKINNIVSNPIKAGVGLHHAYVTNKELNTICCERTIRRLIYKNVLDAKPYNLRRFTAFNHTNHKSRYDTRRKISNIKAMCGRTYKDYLDYIKAHKRANIVQLDSVIGMLNDSNAILTVTFPRYGFQFGLLIKKSNPTSVIRKLRKVFNALNSQCVEKVFPVILADNGLEFSSLYKLEDYALDKKIKTFYTRAYRSCDKAECERYHEYIRYFLPKGKSLDQLSQIDLNNMFSNINSFIRKSKNDKAPYDLVKRAFGKNFLDTINIKKIPAKSVILKQII